MILETVHLPRVYDHTAAKASAERHYNDAIALLLAMQDNCVLITGYDGVLHSELTQYINRWPQKYRTRAQNLIERLRTRNRLIALPCSTPHADGGCRHALELASRSGISAVFVPPSCSCGLGCGDHEDARIVALDEFASSSFAERQRAEMSHVLSEGE